MKRCLVTGSFDPITKGHEDIILRAKAIFDEVYVAVLVNPLKKYTFTVMERLEIIKAAFPEDKNVKVVAYAGLAVDLAKELNASFFVRGVRGAGELAYEMDMADYNYSLSNIETILLPARKELSELSTSAVKNKFSAGEVIVDMLPSGCAEMVEDMLGRKG